MLRQLINWLTRLDKRLAGQSYPVKPPYTGWGYRRFIPRSTLPVFIDMPNTTRPMGPTDASTIVNLRYRINS